jgi:hypothetical protein
VTDNLPRLVAVGPTQLDLYLVTYELGDDVLVYIDTQHATGPAGWTVVPIVPAPGTLFARTLMAGDVGAQFHTPVPVRPERCWVALYRHALAGSRW